MSIYYHWYEKDFKQLYKLDNPVNSPKKKQTWNQQNLQNLILNIENNHNPNIYFMKLKYNEESNNAS